MKRNKKARADGFSLMEAMACLAIIAAVAVPVSAALAVISQGPGERQTRTSVAAALESAMERICAMDFDDVPMSPDENTPADLHITELVDGKPARVKIYVLPYGFLKDAQWRPQPANLDAMQGEPSDPWRLDSKPGAGLLPDPNVKFVRAVLRGMDVCTLLVRAPGEWRPGGAKIAEGFTPPPDPKGKRRFGKYRGCFAPKRKHAMECWLKWVRRRKTCPIRPPCPRKPCSFGSHRRSH